MWALGQVMVVLGASRPGSKRCLGDLTWEAAAASPLRSTLISEANPAHLPPAWPLKKKATWPKTKASCRWTPECLFQPTLFHFVLFSFPHSSLPSPTPPPSTGNPPNVHLFVYTCFCKHCVVSCVNVFVASVHGTVPSVSYFSHASVLKVRVTCCLWLERASYAPWCQPLTSLHILPVMGIPPPRPQPLPPPPLLPSHHNQSGWASFPVSSCTQVRILLGTLTQTWDVRTGEHVLPSSSELCQEALRWSPCLCQHLSLLTFANLMGANCYWIGALVLCFSDDSLKQLFTGLVHWICFYWLFLIFCALFSLGLSIYCCIFLVYSLQWILCWF